MPCCTKRGLSCIDNRHEPYMRIGIVRGRLRVNGYYPTTPWPTRQHLPRWMILDTVAELWRSFKASKITMHSLVPNHCLTRCRTWGTLFGVVFSYLGRHSPKYSIPEEAELNYIIYQASPSFIHLCVTCAWVRVSTVNQTVLKSSENSQRE